MRPENDGIYLRSRPYTFGLGQALNIDVNFLQQALSWEAPEIAEILFVFTGSVTAGAGGAALGRDAAKLFGNIRVEHKEIVVDAAGASLRVNEQIEYGEKQRDPDDVSASGTNASYEYILSVPFEFLKSPNEFKRDCRISLKAFMALGGKFTVRTASALPTNWASISNGVVEVYCRVVEGRQLQVNSFYALQEYSVTQIEDYYPVEGSVRTAVLTSVLATTGYTSQATVVSLDSRSLGWESGLAPRILRDRYRKLHVAIGANDEILLATPGAVPIVTPDKDQRIGHMVTQGKLHLDLNVAVPGSSVFLVGAVRDRHPLYSTYSAGYNDQGQFLSDMLNYGEVRDGGGTKVADFDPVLVNRFPARIKVAG